MLISDQWGLWPSPESNLTASAKALVLYKEFEHCTFKFTATSTRGQWVNFSVGVAETPLNLEHGGRIILFAINFINLRVSFGGMCPTFFFRVLGQCNDLYIFTKYTHPWHCDHLLLMFSTIYPVSLYVHQLTDDRTYSMQTYRIYLYADDMSLYMSLKHYWNR